MEKRTPRSSPLTRLGRAIERAATILFSRSDARARASGWEVRSTGRWNTSRVYHDPRYDRLAACPSCAGRGCRRCSDTGRIVRPAPDRPARGAAGVDQRAADRSAYDRAAYHRPAPDRAARDAARRDRHVRDGAGSGWVARDWAVPDWTARDWLVGDWSGPDRTRSR